MKAFIRFFIVVLCGLFVSCGNEAQGGKSDGILTVATWNVQNIFDAKDDGTEYAEFLKSSGWNEKAYKSRLKNLAIVFSYFDADIVVLNEVENEDVVKDIIAELGAKKSQNPFKYYAIAQKKDGAISIAVISKFQIKSAKKHNIGDERPILETEFDCMGLKVHLFAVHAKSKLGDETETAQIRRNFGQKLKKLMEQYPNDLVIAAGDFNEQISDNNIFSDIRYSLGGTDDVIRVGTAILPNSYYSPYLDPNISLNTQGSYFYNDSWEQIDNILVSYTPNWKVIDSNTVFKGILVNSYGKPNRYNRNLLNGVSDHIPLYVKLKK